MSTLERPPVTLTPCRDDGRKALSLEWGGVLTIGRPWLTGNESGMPTDTRVSRKHLHLVAEKSSGLVRVTVLGQYGVSLHRFGLGMLFLPQGAEFALANGDELFLVDENMTPPAKTLLWDSSPWAGNRCAYSVGIIPAPQANKRSAAGASSDDGRRVRARSDAAADERAQHEEERAFETKLAALQAEADARVQQAQQRESAAEERASRA